MKAISLQALMNFMRNNISFKEWEISWYHPCQPGFPDTPDFETNIDGFRFRVYCRGHRAYIQIFSNEVLLHDEVSKNPFATGTAHDGSDDPVFLFYCELKESLEEFRHSETHRLARLVKSGYDPGAM
jgi:hypothetical protein